VTGRSDDRLAEVLTGLKAGETIAVTNTFLLKAEFLKSSAED
jgi:cobalt-zinc-cadmium efflux system membrane fusion protein